MRLEDTGREFSTFPPWLGVSILLVFMLIGLIDIYQSDPMWVLAFCIFCGSWIGLWAIIFIAFGGVRIIKS